MEEAVGRLVMADVVKVRQQVAEGNNDGLLPLFRVVQQLINNTDHITAGPAFLICIGSK